MIIDTNVQESFFDGSIRIFGKEFQYSGDIIAHSEQEHYYDGDRGTHAECISYREAIITGVTSKSGYSLQDTEIKELIEQDALKTYEWNF